MNKIYYEAIVRLTTTQAPKIEETAEATEQVKYHVATIVKRYK